MTQKISKKGNLLWNRKITCEASWDLVKILWDSPYVTILWKLSLSKGASILRGKVGWDKVAYWLQRCKWLLLPFLSSWSYHNGLCWCMPRKKKGRFWSEAGADYLPIGSNKVKVGRWWSGFLLLDCCGWVVILGSACVEICWGGFTGKQNRMCRQLGQEFDGQGTPMGEE